MKWIDGHCTLGTGLMHGQSLSALLREMDENDVAMSVISPCDQAMAVNNPSGNDEMLRARDAHPDRLIPFCTVNPWYGARAVEELYRCRAQGAAGLSLHPAYQGFQITDPIAMPVYEAAVALEMPMYIVTGIPVCAMPMQLNYIANLFPQGVFIEGRFGFPDFWIDALPSVRDCPNIYVDIAYNPSTTCEQAVRTLGAERVLFCSDAPYLSLREEIEKLSHLRISEEERDLIGGENMRRLLKGGMPDGH